MPEFDNRWRPEPHPHHLGDWLVTRYRHDDGRSVRDVATETVRGKLRARRFRSEKAAEQHADTLNPVPEIKGAEPLTDSQLNWLRRLAASPEGIMEAGTHNTLLSLEFHDLAISSPEPGYLGRDRWRITDKGRKEIA